MTRDDFRRLALSMPESCESAHMGHPDFRVKGKVFATLLPGEHDRGMVKLTPEQQRRFVESDPHTFAPVRGGWGVRGATEVVLEAADERAVREALLAAWRNVAPKRLVAESDPDDVV